MTEKQPLSWKKILLCASLAGPLGVGVSFGLLLLIQLIPGVDGLDEALGSGFGFVVTLFLLLLAYLPLTALLALGATLFLIRHRPLAHSLLAALLSVPIAILFVYLLVNMFGSPG